MPTNVPKNQSQVDRFREAARELETDDREEAFDRALKRVVSVPPKADPPLEPDDKPKR